MLSLQRESASNFEIIKMEPLLILMRHRETRRIYRYVESTDLNYPALTQCPHLVLPLRIETGYLYQSCFMSLGSQLHNITRGGEKCGSDEQELVNTIEPIIESLDLLHSKGHCHGALSPDNIVIDQMGSLRLYYPGIKESTSIYYSDPTPDPGDDFRALGLLCLQLIGFGRITQDEELKVLRYIAKCQKYSDGFVFALLCMLRKKTKFLALAISTLLKKEGASIGQSFPEQAKQYFEYELAERLKRSQQTKRVVQKVQFTPPMVKHLDHTPRKTLATKKCVKLQDSENRKYLQDAKKKKPLEHVLKRVSNGKNESDNNVVVSPSPNYKKILRDIRETKEKQDLFKMAVTIKRMRTVSKKKVG